MDNSPSFENLNCLEAQPRFTRVDATCLRVAAPAKINLNLLVGPIREDGFHPLDSYVATITLYDWLTLRSRDDGEIRFRCAGHDVGPDSENLALRAAQALLAASPTPPGGADIELEKHIPPGTGLGGASSDAAAVLAGLMQLWELDLSQEALFAMAAELGSDVPLFLAGTGSHMTGRGEVLSPASFGPFYAILCTPGIHCPTGEVYAAFDRCPEAMEEQLPPSQLAGPATSWAGRLVNQLAGPAFCARPALAKWYDALASAAARPVSVTGSGSAMFILCDTPEDAQATMGQLPTDLRQGCRVIRSER